jgi:hypothetical protein
VAVIRLSKGLEATVDDDDLHLVEGASWWAHKSRRTWYAHAKADGRFISMHRILMGEPDCSVDHIDGNGLNNSRTNLRLAAAGQNNANMRKRGGCSSRYKGVSRFKENGKWMAYIRKGGELRYLGLFVAEIDAARIYDAAALQLFGEFAKTNEMLGLLPETLDPTDCDKDSR